MEVGRRSFAVGIRSAPKVAGLVNLLFVFFLCFPTSTGARDPLDPNGNITIKWDLINWTPDGYVALVAIFNYQKYHEIKAPGWNLRWKWAKNEVIWAVYGALVTDQGDCSRFKGIIPFSCRGDPTIVDLLPGTPLQRQVGNCCKGGVLKPWEESSFQMAVGMAGNTNKTVKLPRNFVLETPGSGFYSCGSAKIVGPTKFPTPDGRRIVQSLMTWNVVCTYSRRSNVKSEISVSAYIPRVKGMIGDFISHAHP